jgi:hypothetical protein
MAFMGRVSRICARWILFAVVFAIAALAPCASAAENDTENQLWPEANAYVRIDSSHRLWFLLTGAREPKAAPESIQLGAHYELGLYPRFRESARARYDADRLRFLRLRLGIRRLAPLSGSEGPEEWRGIAELTPRFTLSRGAILAFRNRADLRWIDDHYSWRYRPRLWLEREFVLEPHHAVIPYASAEVFYDSRYNDWVRARYQVGVAVVLATWLSPEVYYARERNTASSPEYINALGLVWAMFF